MPKNAAVAVPQVDAVEVAALRRAMFATLEGRACTDAARALTEAVNADVIRERSRWEAQGAPKTNRKKLKHATEALLADLVAANGDWIYRSSKSARFTGARVGARVFSALRDAMHDLRLIEHREGVSQWVDGFSKFAQDEQGGLVARRWASRYRPTPKLIAIAAKHGITPANLFEHFDYGLPKEPLQKRAASKRDAGRKVQGRIIKFTASDRSQKLEAEVRELNEYLAKQTFGGGCVHHGYVRIFNDGDREYFDWNLGGRLYSQPMNGSYQQQSSARRLEMTINGSPVVEIDLRASYLTIFHAWHGVELDPNQDPYVIPELGEEARHIVKLWVAATFGSAKPLSRWPSDLLKNYEEENKRPLDRKRYTVAGLRKKITAYHPTLSKWGSPIDGRVRTWADLMFAESRVIVDTMLWLMRNRDIPSLAVHDSLIVPQNHQEQAVNALRAIYWGHLKFQPLIKIKGPVHPRPNTRNS